MQATCGTVGRCGGGGGEVSKHTALIDRADTHGTVALGLLPSNRTKDDPSQKTSSSYGHAQV